MITKKRAILLIGVILLVGVGSLLYYYYMAKPSGFLSESKILIELNRYSDSKATEIIDIIEIDKEHIFVPFITSENRYGSSLWMWKKHKWDLVADSTTGGPEVWKIESNDPSSYAVFWNIHPDDKISYGDFYAIRERNYRITDGEHTYIPRIQLKTNISFEDTPYGMMKLPKEWIAVLDESAKLQQATQSDNSFPGFFPVNQDVTFGWIPYNSADEEVHADNTLVGGGSSGVDLSYVRTLNKVDELEYIDVED